MAAGASLGPAEMCFPGRAKGSLGGGVRFPDPSPGFQACSVARTHCPRFFHPGEGLKTSWTPL